MYKLQLYNQKKQFERSLNLENFQQITLKNQLGEMRELKIIADLNLGINYKQIVTSDDKLIYLELENSQMLFEKKTNSFSHLFAIGGAAQGTNEQTVILLNGIFSSSFFANQFDIVEINGQFYIKNPNYIGTDVKIKIQQFENCSDQNELYKKACSYIKNFENNSKQQIDKINGQSEITYISTAFKSLKYSQRNIAINTIYSGSLLNFLQLLSNDTNWVLLNGDQFLNNYDTGSFDNFDMFDEVVKKIQGYNYRDLGFYNGKNTIEIADFSSLPVEYVIKNNESQNNFYKKEFNFEDIEFLYPSIAIKFSPNKFVKEGSSVLLDYKQVLYPKNCDGFIRQLQKKLVYQGADFTNIIDYLPYNL